MAAPTPTSSSTPPPLPRYCVRASASSAVYSSATRPLFFVVNGVGKARDRVFTYTSLGSYVKEESWLVALTDAVTDEGLRAALAHFQSYDTGVETETVCAASATPPSTLVQNGAVSPPALAPAPVAAIATVVASPAMLLSRAQEEGAYLREKNGHPRDAYVEFFEKAEHPVLGLLEHKYVFYGDRLAAESVTGVLKAVESDPFDADRVAAQIAASARPNPRYTVTNACTGAARTMTAPEILAVWQDANVKGTHLHGCCERYMNWEAEHGRETALANATAAGFTELAEFHMMLRWWAAKQALGYRHYLAEKVLHGAPVPRPTCAVAAALDPTTYYDLAGSVDWVMLNAATGGLVIVDWKRCNTSSAGFASGFKGKRFLPPLDDVEECTLAHWRLQVNIYRVLFERFYGVKVEGMVMVVLNGDDGATEAREFWHESDPHAEIAMKAYARPASAFLASQAPSLSVAEASADVPM